MCVDAKAPKGPVAARFARKHPHLHHWFADGGSVGELEIVYTPNRVVVDVASRRVTRWWDGTHGNVLQGPHGKSRRGGNTTSTIMKEIAAALGEA